MTEVTPQTKTARHLTQIVDMYPDLLAQAVSRGGDGKPGKADRILGGDAMVLLAPGADRAYTAYRHMSELMGRVPAPAETYESDADPSPVLQTLAYWADELRAERGEPTSLTPTIRRCADYIRHSLDWAYSDQAEEFDAEGMLADLGRLRSRMEAVLKQGYRNETGAPCPACGEGALIKSYSNVPGEHGHLCENDECPGCKPDDRWNCRSEGCGQWWSNADYRARVDAAYVMHADELTASDLSSTYRIPEGTIRVWANRGKVAKRGKDRNGRQLYDVSDALKCRDEIPTREGLHS